jgi:hypothetical protein
MPLELGKLKRAYPGLGKKRIQLIDTIQRPQDPYQAFEIAPQAVFKPLYHYPGDAGAMRKLNLCDIQIQPLTVYALPYFSEHGYITHPFKIHGGSL